MSKRKVKVMVSLAAVIVVAVLIFIFSSQDGSESSALSGAITEWVVAHLVPGFRDMAEADRLRIMDTAHLIVRKAAHFSEYALLALTLVIYLHYILEHRKPTFMALVAWIAATLYACTDELHQMFVVARGPAVTDVCIDSGGALAGALVGLILVVLRLGYKAKRARLA
ncbi:MAG: VanZ family protein [Clostridia bacterium]|nr:VanZ family protein [Clostridia bacterium]